MGWSFVFLTAFIEHFLWMTSWRHRDGKCLAEGHGACRRHSMGVWLQNPALRCPGARSSDPHVLMSYAESAESGKGRPSERDSPESDPGPVLSWPLCVQTSPASASLGVRQRKHRPPRGSAAGPPPLARHSAALMGEPGAVLAVQVGSVPQGHWAALSGPIWRCECSQQGISFLSRPRAGGPRAAGAALQAGRGVGGPKGRALG